MRIRLLLVALCVSLAATSALACENAMKEKTRKQPVKTQQQKRQGQMLQLAGVLAFPLGIAGLLLARRRRLEFEVENEI